MLDSHVTLHHAKRSYRGRNFNLKLGQGEARHRKYKGLKLGGGEAYDSSCD
jgi:hypothetical protein